MSRNTLDMVQVVKYPGLTWFVMSNIVKNVKNEELDKILCLCCQKLIKVPMSDYHWKWNTGIPLWTECELNKEFKVD